MARMKVADAGVHHEGAPERRGGDRCTGRCCRGFPLPYSPTALANQATTIEDGVQIAAMVIPRGEYPERPGFWRYDCKNLLPSGDCVVYETRPRMCSDYPYGLPCSWGEECEWDVARQGTAGKRREPWRRHLPIWHPLTHDTPDGRAPGTRIET